MVSMTKAWFVVPMEYSTKRKDMVFKLSFMHYMKWASIMLPLVFVDFEMVKYFFAIFFFSLSFSTLAKICGSCSLPAPGPPPQFLRACTIVLLYRSPKQSADEFELF